MSDRINEVEENVALPMGPNDEEIKKREKALLETKVQTLLEREREQHLADLLDVIGDLEKPTRAAVDLVPNHYQNPQHRGVAKIASPNARYYSRMSEEEREIRNPDSDHWMTMWLRGKATNDRATMLQADAELERMFPRAQGDVLAEGAAGANAAYAATAGEFLPRPLEQVVLINRDRVAKMRRFASVFQMTRQQHTIPTYDAMLASMVGESTTATGGEGNVAAVELVAKKAQVVAAATRELLDDAAVNVVNIFATRAGMALGALEDSQAFNSSVGTGTGNNITAISGTAYAEPASGTLTVNDVVAMYFAVDQVYRDRAVWFAASDVLTALSGLQDTNSGRPIYDSLLNAPGVITDDTGQVGQLMRRPVYEVPMTDGDIWFGDPSAAYALGDRQGLRVDVSSDVNFFYDQVVWKFTHRFAGIPVDITNATAFARNITAASV
jgi:HK97 family phage major capsid protein